MNLSTRILLTRAHLTEHLARRLHDMNNDKGMSTIEYAMGTLGAAALAAVLYMVITSDNVSSAIEGIINDALTNTPV